MYNKNLKLSVVGGVGGGGGGIFADNNSKTNKKSPVSNNNQKNLNSNNNTLNSRSLLKGAAAVGGGVVGVQQTQLLENKVRRMEICNVNSENENEQENNNNNTSNTNLDFDHPPSKKLLTSNSPPLQLPSNNLYNTTKMNVDNSQNESAQDKPCDTDDPMNANTQSTEVTLQDGEDESRAEHTFQLTITEFSKFKESRESRLSPQPCIVRNLPWKILAMSKNINNREYVLGFFLQCNADSESTRWSVCATAELRLLHISDPEKNLVKKIQHLFYLKENDWGFSPFTTMKEIMDPEKGYYNQQKDCINLEVWLNADAPHGTAWDSKKLTGYVGLTNQGATCYMNSLLQTLYFTNELRRAVYLMPTDNDDTIKSVPYALQRVFYDLQFCEKSVGTKKLTRSFGWETLDTFMQHDVQELCRVLMDNIENKMKLTKVEGCIPRLFEGKMISYVKCKTIDYESRRVEGFYDIQLNIKGKKDIYESFKDYVTIESLDGENKYDAGKYGLQEAQKGVIFDTFPPILHLHLMRFQYDPNTDSNIKINDKYEFFETIELDPFLEKLESTTAKYLLHAVLVHSGDNHGGHYVVFINPKLDGKWFKFDDEVVSRCSKKDAINNNFGGNSSDELTFRHSTNAYMLVYVRDSQKTKCIINDVIRADIPPTLQERLAEEKKVELMRKKERSEAHLFMQLNIILEKEFYDHLGNSDLYDSTKVEATKQLKVKKSSTMAEILKQISDCLNVESTENIRIWTITSRYNNTVRPLSCIDCSNENANKTISEITKADTAWVIFVEAASDLSFSKNFDYSSTLNTTVSSKLQYPIITPPSPPYSGNGTPHITSSIANTNVLPPFSPKEDVMIFFKFYDPKTTTLRYVFRMHLSINLTLDVIQEKINKKMKFAPNTELLFYEEVKISQITPLISRDITLEQLAHEQLLDGDIYVFQINEKEKFHNYKLPYVPDYFKDLSFQAEITFVDKNTPNDEGFMLTLSLKLKYDEFAKIIGEHLKYDYLRLQFFRTNLYDLKLTSVSPNQSIKYNPDFQLKDAFNMSIGKPQQQQNPQQQGSLGRKLFYQKLNIKISELEERRQFKFLWLSPNLKVEKEITLMPFKKATVKELLNECKSELLTLELITNDLVNNVDVPFKLRLVEIVASKMHRIFKEDVLIEQLETQTTNKVYRVEQIPVDELNLNNSLTVSVNKGDEYLLGVAHFTKEIYATFGTPFYLKVKQGELFKDIKQRIQKKLDVGDKEFLTYRFALISMGTATYLPQDEDAYIFDLSNLNGIQPWLGIDHTNKLANKNKTRFSNMEKAIKIFN